MTGGYGPELYCWVGLSTEAKPREAYPGQRAFETDTGNEFKWTGDLGAGQWVKYHTAGNTDVAIQDQTTRPLIMNFNQVTNSTTLSALAVKGAYTITVTNTTGFTAGKYIIIFDTISSNFSFYTQIGAPAGNVITLDTPLDYAYPIGATVSATITDMSVNGSVTPQVFGLRGADTPPGVEVTVDITRIIFYCVAASAVDLTKFADIAALTRGLVLRKRNTVVENIFNVKSNAELAGLMYDFSVSAATNPVQGVDGFVARLTFSGQEKIGVAIRLPIGEDLEFIVQDNLSGITLFKVVAEGHVIDD